MKNLVGYTKGVNLGGWLSQCDYSDERLNYFIAEEDIAKIASWGVDHVRIPIDYNVLQNEDGSFSSKGFARVDWALAMCKKYKLNTVLDLHKTMGFSFDKGECESGFFDSEELQERFYSLWIEIAKRYGEYFDRVAFELLNEITDQAFSSEWNRISTECIRRIRCSAPDTIILVGSYWNNDAKAVKDLPAPYDEKVVYNMHCYDPLKFTHQGATWTDLINPDERHDFEQFHIDAQYFMEHFASACEAAERNNTVLYCGEYGVIDRVNPEDTVKWFKAIHTAFEELNISRCAWSYKQMDFGLSDERLSGVIDELTTYL